MLLDVKSIVHQPGASIPFSFVMNLAEVDIYDQQPFADPVEVSGTVTNRADVLWLTAEAQTTLHFRCDRCSNPTEQAYRVPVSYMLAEELEDEEQDEILLLRDDTIDLGELFQTEVILALPAKNLCEENCKGLCDGCGANLNVEACTCKREIDPRLAGLAKFFDN